MRAGHRIAPRSRTPLTLSLALSLIAGVPPQAERGRIFSRLENEITARRAGHFWAGITGGSFVVRELVEANRPDLMYLMATQEDYPGWGDMLKRGATAPCE